MTDKGKGPKPNQSVFTLTRMPRSRMQRLLKCCEGTRKVGFESGFHSNRIFVIRDRDDNEFFPRPDGIPEAESKKSA